VELGCFYVGLGFISSHRGPDLSSNRPASPWAHVEYMFCRISWVFLVQFLCNSDISSYR
jgi:hypothetical protein